MDMNPMGGERFEIKDTRTLVSSVIPLLPSGRGGGGSRAWLNGRFTNSGFHRLGEKRVNKWR